MNMNITIDLEIIVRYNDNGHFLESQYNELTSDKKDEILNYFNENEEKINDNLFYYLSNNGIYHGKMTIKEKNIHDKDNKLCMIVKAEYTNPDNYTGNRIRKIIVETCNHYMRSGEAEAFDDYTFNYGIDNVEIEDEDHHNEHGTDKSKYIITCHEYYALGYDNDDEETFMRHYDGDITIDEMIDNAIKFADSHGSYRCSTERINVYKSSDNELLKTCDCELVQNELIKAH